MKSQTSSPRNSKYEISDVRLAYFLEKVNKTNTCWLWTGTRSSTGYGVVKFNNENLLSHRVAFRHTRGFLPGKGLVLDHLCENRLCVNPDHLEVTTINLNATRGRTPLSFKQTFCKNGHRLSETRKVYGKDNPRCRICRSAKVRVYNKRYREAAKMRQKSGI